MKYDFVVPDILLMNSGMDLGGEGAIDTHGDAAIAFRGCQAVTPETDGPMHYFFTRNLSGGTADHRDMVLWREERDAQRSIMICMSLCKAGPLELDL